MDTEHTLPYYNILSGKCILNFYSQTATLGSFSLDISLRYGMETKDMSLTRIIIVVVIIIVLMLRGKNGSEIVPVQ
jgi:hypothetical protein